jgi:protein O-mannosyl-transferase
MDDSQSKCQTRPAGLVPAICLFLAAITFVVFGQTLHHDFAAYDDSTYVYDNPVVQKGLTLKGAIWALTYEDIGHWHPLTWLTHMADCQLYGLKPGGHHLTNVLLHVATVILLFLALRQMTGALWRSAFVAAVFAIHPLRVESVAWISERKDVLSGVFFMLTLSAYARYARRPSRGRYAAVALLYGLGLLCKNTLVTLPFVLLLLDWWPLHRGKGNGAGSGRPAATFWELVKEKIPLFLLSVGSCVATFLSPETVQSSYRVLLLERLENAVVSYGIYLRQMVYPAGLAIPYLYPPNGLPFWQVALVLLLLAAISISVVACRNRRPYLLVGWLWYLGMLVPAIGIIQISYYARADRYTYLPGIGLALAGTWAAGDWSAGWKHRRAVSGVLMAAVIGVLMVCAWKQTSYWKDRETLYRHAIAVTENNSLSENNLGKLLFQKGRVDEALPHLLRAVALDSNYAFAHYNLGNALLAGGDVAGALQQFEIHVHLAPGDPVAQYNFGDVLLNQGLAGEAIPHLEEAVQLSPGAADYHLKLGNAWRETGRTAEAIGQYEKALQILPQYVQAASSLAWVLATTPDASLRHGARAVQLALLANQLSGGQDPKIIGVLAAACAETGDFSKAAAMAQRALELAGAENNSALAETLRVQLALYRAGSPFRDTVKP